jgi:hypothetical protein
MEVAIPMQVIPTPSNPNLTPQAFYVATQQNNNPGGVVLVLMMGQY